MKPGIKEQLIMGYIVVLIIFAVSIGIALHSVQMLQNNVKMTHDHPLTVTRAAIRIETLVTAMHRSMKDVVMSGTSEERENYISLVNNNEDEAVQNFALIQDMILGDAGLQMAEETKNQFLGWRPIRRQVIRLMNEGKTDEALMITRFEGDAYVRQIIALLDELVIYASEKAMGFNRESTEIAVRTRGLILGAFVIGTITSIAVALFLSMSIIQRLSKMKKAAVNIASGKFDEKIEFKGNDELCQLAAHFNQMADTLNQAIADKDDEVDRRTSELQKTNLELSQFKENLEILIRQRTEELNEQVNKLDKSQKAMLYMVEDLNNTSRELKTQREKLSATNKELEAFAYSVSHDLRAPLRQIQGFAEIVKKRIQDDLDDKTLRQLNNISDAATQMGILIDELLSYSRAGRLQLNKIKISTSHMIKEIIDRILESQSETRKIQWKINALPDVVADRIMFEQVIMNLISNAIKFSAKNPAPCIELFGEKQQDEWLFSVRDNGVGFNMQYADKLFGVFQRLHSKDQFEGTGIGLANVQRIIHRHGGRVWAESVQNQGATFYFTLPVRD